MKLTTDQARKDAIKQLTSRLRSSGTHSADAPRRSWLLRRSCPREVVEATIRSGYAFHTRPAAWDEVLGRFDAGPGRPSSPARIRMLASN